MKETGKNDNLIKTLGIVALGLIVFALLNNILLGGQGGMGYGEHYGRGSGIIDLGGLLSSVLVLTVRILWLVFVVSLLVGLVLIIKKYMLDENGAGIKQLVEKIVPAGSFCSCGSRVIQGYKFCPACGKEIGKTVSNQAEKGLEATEEKPDE